MPDGDKADQERLIDKHERKRRTRVSDAQCWRLERDGKFPRRVRLGPRTVRWRLSEILAWIANLETATDASAPAEYPNLAPAWKKARSHKDDAPRRKVRTAPNPNPTP